VNRTERLYALVEELRAVAPRPRTASWLAARFEVSVRTIERDLEGLRQSGVPLWGEVGRTGGYYLDRDRTLPPVTLTAREALAVSVALRSVADSPFAEAAEHAGQKILAVLPADIRRREAAMASQVYLIGEQRTVAQTQTQTQTQTQAQARTQGQTQAPVSGAVCAGLADGRVLRLTYVDSAGTQTDRDVEPLGLLWSQQGWYLMGWCRLRRAVRGFALGRIALASVTDEPVPDRDADASAELDRLAARPLL
jgi:predicted DNA-binding transcriptional regulator YafY